MGSPCITRLAILLALPAPASADGVAPVPLADVSGFSAARPEALPAGLVRAEVVTVNCWATAVDDGEWALLTGTADLLATGDLGLDAAACDARFHAPALRSLADPGACDRGGPGLQGLLDPLHDLGGSSVPAKG